MKFSLRHLKFRDTTYCEHKTGRAYFLNLRLRRLRGHLSTARLFLRRHLVCRFLGHLREPEPLAPERSFCPRCGAQFPAAKE